MLVYLKLRLRRQPPEGTRRPRSIRGARKFLVTSTKFWRKVVTWVQFWRKLVTSVAVPAYPPVMSYKGFSVFDIRHAAGVEVSLQSENLYNLRNEVSLTMHATYKVKAARAAEDDLQAAEKAFADAQAHLELKRAETKIDAHGSSKRKSPTTQAPSNTSTSASGVTVAEETMPDTFLIILPDTNYS
ncbi:hypothetical protein B0H13DRAFT_1909268 [Mycena leptocephala]|nr:hypothetical protein B0H13DRAFT_1909268 [Mycena leptocephala]